MNKPKCLDLFCGAGGASMGYALAGFEVIGVDVNPQPHYPFEFIQADWREPLRYLPGLWEREGESYIIHASPPCQRYSTMTAKWGRQDNHPDFIAGVRDELRAIECIYVIENVETAPLLNPVMLCGSMFGLHSGEYNLRRHRLFESNMFFFPPATCCHTGKTLPVYGHSGGSSKRDRLTFPGVKAWREGMEIDWMTGDELAEAIPPRYTEYIGKIMMETIMGENR